MTCPGSVTLSRGHADTESDFAAMGTSAHAAGAYLLAHGGDAWQLIGREFEGIKVDKEMADAVQVYAGWARETFRGVNELLIEHRFHCPSIHKMFYGTVDLAAKIGRTLYIADYKHGAGIVVDAEDNPQLKYYACGYLESFGAWDEVDEIVLTIVQPRAFHRDGPIRSWSMRVGDLVDWLENDLIPAMDRAMVSRDTKSGEHCRFCPVRFAACPQLLKDTEEFHAMSETIEKEGAKVLTNEQLSRYLDLATPVKIALKAAQETAFHRLQAGTSVPGYKLVPGRTNREFKEGAEKAAVETFGDDAYTEPKLKSPAEIDKLPKGVEFTARWAEKPPGALQVAPVSDARTGVNRDVKSKFAPVNRKKKEK